MQVRTELTSLSGVSRGKGERWKPKRERAEGEKRLTQMLLLEPFTPTQHDSIPSNQNQFRSLGCQLQVSKSSPKINLTLRSGRAPVLVLVRFRFFLKPPMRSFRILLMKNLPFLRNYNMFQELCQCKIALFVNKRAPGKLQPAKTSLSPCSSPLGTFRPGERLRLSGRY